MFPMYALSSARTAPTQAQAPLQRGVDGVVEVLFARMKNADSKITAALTSNMYDAEKLEVLTLEGGWQALVRGLRVPVVQAYNRASRMAALLSDCSVGMMITFPRQAASISRQQVTRACISASIELIHCEPRVRAGQKRCLFVKGQDAAVILKALLACAEMDAREPPDAQHVVVFDATGEEMAKLVRETLDDRWYLESGTLQSTPSSLQVVFAKKSEAEALLDEGVGGFLSVGDAKEVRMSYHREFPATLDQFTKGIALGAAKKWQARNLEGQKVVMLFGDTQVGKTTLILAQIGFPIEAVRVETSAGTFTTVLAPMVDFLQPGEVLVWARGDVGNVQLLPTPKGVTLPVGVRVALESSVTDPKMIAEPFRVCTDKVGSSTTRDVFVFPLDDGIAVLDAAGTKDSQGLQTDVSNGVQKCDAMDAASEVRSVLVLEVGALRSSGGTFKTAVSSLLGFMTNFEDDVSKVGVFLTKPYQDVQALQDAVGDERKTAAVVKEVAGLAANMLAGARMNSAWSRNEVALLEHIVKQLSLPSGERLVEIVNPLDPASLMRARGLMTRGALSAIPRERLQTPMPEAGIKLLKTSVDGEVVQFANHLGAMDFGKAAANWIAVSDAAAGLKQAKIAYCYGAVHTWSIEHELRSMTQHATQTAKKLAEAVEGHVSRRALDSAEGALELFKRFETHMGALMAMPETSASLAGRMAGKVVMTAKQHATDTWKAPHYENPSIASRWDTVVSDVAVTQQFLKLFGVAGAGLDVMAPLVGKLMDNAQLPGAIEDERDVYAVLATLKWCHAGIATCEATPGLCGASVAREAFKQKADIARSLLDDAAAHVAQWIKDPVAAAGAPDDVVQVAKALRAAINDTVLLSLLNDDDFHCAAAARTKIAGGVRDAEAGVVVQSTATVSEVEVLVEWAVHRVRCARDVTRPLVGTAPKADGADDDAVGAGLLQSVARVVEGHARRCVDSLATALGPPYDAKSTRPAVDSLVAIARYLVALDKVSADRVARTLLRDVEQIASRLAEGVAAGRSGATTSMRRCLEPLHAYRWLMAVATEAMQEVTALSATAVVGSDEEGSTSTLPAQVALIIETQVLRRAATRAEAVMSAALQEVKERSPPADGVWRPSSVRAAGNEWVERARRDVEELLLLQAGVRSFAADGANEGLASAVEAQLERYQLWMQSLRHELADHVGRAATEPSMGEEYVRLMLQVVRPLETASVAAHAGDDAAKGVLLVHALLPPSKSTTTEGATQRLIFPTFEEQLRAAHESVGELGGVARHGDHVRALLSGLAKFRLNANDDADLAKRLSEHEVDLRAALEVIEKRSENALNTLKSYVQQCDATVSVDRWKELLSALPSDKSDRERTEVARDARRCGEEALNALFRGRWSSELEDKLQFVVQLERGLEAMQHTAHTIAAADKRWREVMARLKSQLKSSAPNWMQLLATVRTSRLVFEVLRRVSAIGSVDLPVELGDSQVEGSVASRARTALEGSTDVHELEGLLAALKPAQLADDALDASAPPSQESEIVPVDAIRRGREQLSKVREAASARESADAEKELLRQVMHQLRDQLCRRRQELETVVDACVHSAVGDAPNPNFSPAERNGSPAFKWMALELLPQTLKADSIPFAVEEIKAIWASYLDPSSSSAESADAASVGAVVTMHLMDELVSSLRKAAHAQMTPAVEDTLTNMMQESMNHAKGCLQKAARAVSDAAGSSQAASNPGLYLKTLHGALEDAATWYCAAKLNGLRLQDRTDVGLRAAIARGCEAYAACLRNAAAASWTSEQRHFRAVVDVALTVGRVERWWTVAVAVQDEEAKARGVRPASVFVAEELQRLVAARLESDLLSGEAAKNVVDWFDELRGVDGGCAYLDFVKVCALSYARVEGLREKRDHYVATLAEIAALKKATEEALVEVNAQGCVTDAHQDVLEAMVKAANKEDILSVDASFAHDVFKQLEKPHASCAKAHLQLMQATAASSSELLKNASTAHNLAVAVSRLEGLLKQLPKARICVTVEERSLTILISTRARVEAVLKTVFSALEVPPLPHLRRDDDITPTPLSLDDTTMAAAAAVRLMSTLGGSELQAMNGTAHGAARTWGAMIEQCLNTERGHRPAALGGFHSEWLGRLALCERMAACSESGDAAVQRLLDATAPAPMRDDLQAKWAVKRREAEDEILPETDVGKLLQWMAATSSNSAHPKPDLNDLVVSRIRSTMDVAEKRVDVDICSAEMVLHCVMAVPPAAAQLDVAVKKLVDAVNKRHRAATAVVEKGLKIDSSTTELTAATTTAVFDAVTLLHSTKKESVQANLTKLGNAMKHILQLVAADMAACCAALEGGTELEGACLARLLETVGVMEQRWETACKTSADICKILHAAVRLQLVHVSVTTPAASIRTTLFDALHVGAELAVRQMESLSVAAVPTAELVLRVRSAASVLQTNADRFGGPTEKTSQTLCAGLEIMWCSVTRKLMEEWASKRASDRMSGARLRDIHDAVMQLQEMISRLRRTNLLPKDCGAWMSSVGADGPLVPCLKDAVVVWLSASSAAAIGHFRANRVVEASAELTAMRTVGTHFDPALSVVEEQLEAAVEAIAADNDIQRVNELYRTLMSNGSGEGRAVAEATAFQPCRTSAFRRDIAERASPECVSRDMRVPEGVCRSQLQEALLDFEPALQTLVEEFLTYALQHSYEASSQLLRKKLWQLRDTVMTSASVENMKSLVYLAAFAFTWVCDGQAYLKHRRADAIRTLHNTQIAFLLLVFGVVGPQEDGYGAASVVRGLADAGSRGKVSTRMISEALMRGHLVELPSGEGKSIALCVCAMIFALLGARVDVLCYSKILTERDALSASRVLSALELDGLVRYLTLDELMERRAAVLRHAASEVLRRNGMKASDGTRCLTEAADAADDESAADVSVLLFDEVDMLFEPEFSDAGEGYQVVARLSHDKVATLLRYVYGHRGDTNLTVRGVCETPEYAGALQAVSGWMTGSEPRALLRQLVLDAMRSRSFFGRQLNLHELYSEAETRNSDADTAHYVVDPERGIGYLQPDGSVAYGTTLSRYRSALAYLEAVRTGAMRATAAFDELYLSMPVPITVLKYSDVPRFGYAVVHGVTGSLSELLPEQKVRLMEMCGFGSEWRMPSVYKAVTMVPGECVLASDFKEWSTQIMAVIAKKVKLTTGSKDLGHPVVVYFENRRRLRRFQRENQGDLERLRVRVARLTAGVEDAEGATVNATLQGQVTLATREFGRGVDFRCGQCESLTIVLAYLPLSLAEEEQVRRRTCRQGSPGEFHFIVLREDAAAALRWKKGQAPPACDGGKSLLVEERQKVIRSTVDVRWDVAVLPQQALDALLLRCPDDADAVERARSAVWEYACRALGPAPAFTIAIDTSAKVGGLQMATSILGEVFKAMKAIKNFFSGGGGEKKSFRESLQCVLNAFRDELTERVNIERVSIQLITFGVFGYQGLSWTFDCEQPAVALDDVKFGGDSTSFTALQAAGQATGAHVVIIHGNKDTSTDNHRDQAASFLVATSTASSITCVSLDPEKGKSKLQTSLEAAATKMSKQSLVAAEVPATSVQAMWNVLADLLQTVTAEKQH